MGFGGSLTSTYQDNYKDISKEELLEADVSYEILGRFVSIINFKRLDSDDVNRIIDLLLKKRSKENGIEVDITEALRKRLLNSANTGYGCRLISNTIDELLLEALIEVYEKPNKYSRIILDMEKRYELEVRTMQIKKSNS